MDQRFHQHERLKSRKQIQQLFEEGTAVKGYPVLGVYLKDCEHHGVQVGFSVSKKKFNRAVDRNLLKRRMREAYRLNRDESGINGISGVSIMLIYLPNELVDYKSIEKGIRKILLKLAEVITSGSEQSSED